MALVLTDHREAMALPVSDQNRTDWLNFSAGLTLRIGRGISGGMMRTYPIIVASLWTASALSAAQDLEFEVASVRGPTPPPWVGLMKGGPGSSDLERISYSRVAMGLIIEVAFGVRGNEIVGPDWLFLPNTMSGPAYDIEAKVPPGTTKEQANEMMRNLLKARFHLAVHFEKRNLDGYELLVAKGGPKLTPAAPAEGPAPVNPDVVFGGPDLPRDKDGFPVLPPGYPKFRGLGANGHMLVTARAMPLSSLQDILSVFLYLLHAPHLVDKTGLTGTYDFKLDYVQGPPQLGPGDDQSASAPDVFTALEKQLGLTLKQAKVPVDVLVIDHIEKAPTEN